MMRTMSAITAFSMTTDPMSVNRTSTATALAGEGAALKTASSKAPSIIMYAPKNPSNQLTAYSCPAMSPGSKRRNALAKLCNNRG